MSLSRVTRLRAERIRRGLSQQKLGFYANIAATDLSKIETCRMVPYPGQAERLAKLTGLRPEELQELISAEEAETLMSDGPGATR